VFGIDQARFGEPVLPILVDTKDLPDWVLPEEDGVIADGVEVIGMALTEDASETVVFGGVGCCDGEEEREAVVTVV